MNIFSNLMRRSSRTTWVELVAERYLAEARKLPGYLGTGYDARKITVYLAEDAPETVLPEKTEGVPLVAERIHGRQLLNKESPVWTK